MNENMQIEIAEMLANSIYIYLIIILFAIGKIIATIIILSLYDHPCN